VEDKKLIVSFEEVIEELSFQIGMLQKDITIERLKNNKLVEELDRLKPKDE
jgi:uncharacterized coiled-coil protein SlyX